MPQTISALCSICKGTQQQSNVLWKSSALVHKALLMKNNSSFIVVFCLGPSFFRLYAPFQQCAGAKSFFGRCADAFNLTPPKPETPQTPRSSPRSVHRERFLTGENEIKSLYVSKTYNKKRLKKDSVALKLRWYLIKTGSGWTYFIVQFPNRFWLPWHMFVCQDLWS